MSTNGAPAGVAVVAVPAAEAAGAPVAADGVVAHWPLHLDKAGAWDVALRYAVPGFGEQARFELGVDGQTLLQGTAWGTCSADSATTDCVGRRFRSSIEEQRCSPSSQAWPPWR